MSRYVTHLEAAIDGTRLDADVVQTMHLDRPLWVRYDLDAVRRALTKEDLLHRAPTMWRYRELLPADSSQAIVTLGEGMTPILPCDRLGDRLGISKLWIKDESQLPTGSFKSRGQTVAVTMAQRFGITRLAIPTAGNAGGAMAAYAARAGMEAFVFMPADTPLVNQFEAQLAGAKVFLVDGLITDCGKIVRAGMEPMNWFDVSTLKEPYRIEGKKTMGLELAEQFDWKLPDVILYPTGGGTGLIGMWKAFQELSELGWLDAPAMPRMVAVQSDGCCPIVRAFERGARFAEPFEAAHTIASGIRVPAAVGDFMILDAVRQSDGCAVAVQENRILEWMQAAIASEGISICPEAAACVGAAEKLAASGWIKPNESVVLFNCGAAQKYPQLMAKAPARLQRGAELDWDWISRGGVAN
jgi:threonine synthase